jgi:predicted permease
VLQLLGGAAPVRLDLAPDWRVAAFAGLLALLATVSFGLVPAWRSAAIRPMQAIRGGADDRRRRLAPVLIAVQSAFCVVIVVLAALFVGTFDRVANQPMGFTADGVVLVDVFSRSAQPLAAWDDASAALTGVPGVERVAMAAYPLLSGRSSNGFITVAGGATERTLSTFLTVSSGWLDAMRVPLVSGRDFGPADVRPGSAIVNQAFVDTYFAGVDPVGRTFDRTNGSGRFTIVGVVANVRYRELRGAIQPTAFLPFRAVGPTGQAEKVWGGTFVVRTGLADPAALATTLRRAIAARQPPLLVSVIRTQDELIEVVTRRERLLSMLGTFFAVVALLLAAVGLYGVLDDAVVQRRREIGIRVAIGARAAHVLRTTTAGALAMVGLGGLIGWGGAVLLARSLGALVYEVHPTSPAMAAIPSAALLTVAALAALRPALHALHIDPVRVLRE